MCKFSCVTAYADIRLTLGYGRPLTSDRPPPLTADMISSFSPRDQRQWAIVAQSELVPCFRNLISDPSPDNIATINDDLDAWFFKWTSPASEFSAPFATNSTYTLILAHNIRLCLNLLPLRDQDQSSPQSKAHRLALTAAVEIIELHDRDRREHRNPSLRFAPNVTGTILAHATLCLQPPNSSYTSLAAFSPSPTVDKYFALGMELLRTDLWNQGRFTPTLARTLANVSGRALPSHRASPEADWMLLAPDFSGVMGWLEDDSGRLFDLT